MGERQKPAAAGVGRLTLNHPPLAGGEPAVGQRGTTGRVAAAVAQSELAQARLDPLV
jgi:hypothetical protein